MDEQEAQATAVAVAEEAGIPRLAARLRRARRWYAAAAVVLAAAGLGAAAAGLLGVAPFPERVTAPALVAVGLLAAALAALPWREALDRRDRADGLEVLAEEWAGLPSGDDAGRAALLRLVGVVCGGDPRDVAGEQ